MWKNANEKGIQETIKNISYLHNCLSKGERDIENLKFFG